MPSSFCVENFRPHGANITHFGFFDLRHADTDLTIRDVMLHEVVNGDRCICLKKIPQLDANGTHRVERGMHLYTQNVVLRRRLIDENLAQLEPRYSEGLNCGRGA